MADKKNPFANLEEKFKETQKKPKKEKVQLIIKSIRNLF